MSERGALPSTGPYTDKWIPSASSRPSLGSRGPLRVPLTECEVPLREDGYDICLGVGVGLVIAGPQDLKFKRYGAGGALVDSFFSDDVDTSTEHMETVGVTAWRRGGFLDGFGLRVEAARWSVRARAISFVDRLGSSVAMPPFRAVDEDRFGAFASLAKRWSLSRGAAVEDSPYLFAGLGLGSVRSEVNPGDTLWASAFESYVGFSLPVSPRVRLIVEGILLVTHDVDVEGRPQDWRVDTSGTHLAHLNAHFDTRFFAALIGIEFQF